MIEKKKIISFISFTYKVFVILLLFILYLRVNDLEQVLRRDKKIPTKEEKYNSLSHVSVSVQIEYLRKYLGNPAIINGIEGKNQKEYIFIDLDYYVLATTDLDNSVLSYVITTRKKGFNPILEIGSVKVQLGKSTFYEKGVKPDDCKAMAGNTAPSYYFEKYLGDNLSSYQSYMFGYNDAGYGDRGIVEATLPNEEEIKNKNFKFSDGLHCRLPTDEDRKKYTINTFGVGWPLTVGVNRRLMERIN